jgi:drug/metabolite transporter (DMT)-like permease
VSGRPYLTMIVGCVFFAVMATIAHAAGSLLAWQTVAMGRCLVPLVFVAIWCRQAGVPLVFLGPPALWLRSIAGSISLVSTFYALNRLPPPEVYSLTSMYPIWVAVLSWPMLGEFPGLGVWLSVACSVLGVWLIYPINPSSPVPTADDVPVLAALFASLMTSLAMLGLHRLQRFDSKAIVVHFSMTALVFAMVAAAVLPGRTDLPPPPWWAGLAILVLGIMATFGQICLTKAFTFGEPAKVSVVNLTQIPMTLLLDVIFFQHEFQPMKLVGMALILGPTAWLLAAQKATHLPLDHEPPEP